MEKEKESREREEGALGIRFHADAARTSEFRIDNLFSFSIPVITSPLLECQREQPTPIRSAGNRPRCDRDLDTRVLPAPEGPPIPSAGAKRYHQSSLPRVHAALLTAKHWTVLETTALDMPLPIGSEPSMGRVAVWDRLHILEPATSAGRLLAS